MPTRSESNWVEEAVRTLDDGSVFVDYGPVSMVISATKGGTPQTAMCQAAFPLIERTLRQMSENLEHLRKYPPQLTGVPLDGVAQWMREAVERTGEPTLTPMATVAGAMADTVADWLAGQGAERVFVNNGGDVAIRLAPGQQAGIGLMPSLKAGGIDLVLTISADDGIGGVCTSGLGGRSLTRGVADAVCALAATCRQADALATHLANCSYIESPRVLRMRAGELDAGSDIAGLDVTTFVGELTEEEKRAALSGVRAECERQMKLGNLIGAVACVQSTIMCHPGTFFQNKLKGVEHHGSANQENCCKQGRDSLRRL